MQRLWPCPVSPETYLENHLHLEVHPEVVCPRCSSPRGLHAHGIYRRWLTGSQGQVLRLPVARFFCPACEGTVSYLPDFALSYRLVNARTVEAAFDGQCQRPDVVRTGTLCQSYWRRLIAWAPSLRPIIGAAFGRAPPAPAPLWPWLKKACGSLIAATRELVTTWRVTLFAR